METEFIIYHILLFGTSHYTQQGESCVRLYTFKEEMIMSGSQIFVTL